LPDLIVSKIECGAGNKLSVTIKNIGSGTLPSGWQATAEVYFNQTKKGTFGLKYPTSTTGGGIEQPGGSSTYLVAWDITAPVIVMVIADSTDSITESNEQNNSKEEKIEPLLPDLIVSKIECGPGNKLSVTIKNIGSGDLPAGWTATAKAYFDDEEKGFFGLTSPTSTSGGGIEKAGGSSTYLIAWDITAPVTVRVIADSNNSITESNELNNSKEEEVEPLISGLPDLVATGVDTIPSRIEVGQPICLKPLIENTGAVTSDPCAVMFYVDGEKLVTVDISAIPAGQSLRDVEEVCAYWTPAEAGPHQVRFIVDVDEVVDESDDENNEIEIEFDVLAASEDTEPPEVTITYSPESPTDTDRITFNIHVVDPSGIGGVTLYVAGSSRTPTLTSEAEGEADFSYTAGPPLTSTLTVARSSW
jgi:hypothetical protein